MTQNVTQKATQEAIQDTTQEATQVVTQDMTQEATQVVTLDATQVVTQVITQVRLAYLTHLSNTHGAENVEEYKGAVVVVGTRQVPVADALKPGQGLKGQLSYHSAVKSTTIHK